MMKRWGWRLLMTVALSAFVLALAVPTRTLTRAFSAVEGLSTGTLTRALPTEFVPATWHVTASALADVTGDGKPEWALVVWRPWRDWPIQRWSSVPSPISTFQDAAGNSCHLILLDPEDGREIWAGSALPAPILALIVEDVDEDGVNEVVTLEGRYAHGDEGPATRVDVWRWNGFGFTLDWRSPAGDYALDCLTEVDRCGIR
jgi:hypothetical protein